MARVAIKSGNLMQNGQNEQRDKTAARKTVYLDYEWCRNLTAGSDKSRNELVVKTVNDLEVHIACVPHLEGERYAEGYMNKNKKFSQ